MITPENYFKQHPEATLKEYIDACDNMEKTRAEQEREREKAELEYFREHYAGKYVKITFHSQAHTFCGPIPNDIMYGDRKVPCLDVHNNSAEYGPSLKVQYEKRTINRFWLQNPYFPVVNRTNVTCEVITKEDYEHIKEVLYDNYAKIIVEEVNKVKGIENE